MLEYLILQPKECSRCSWEWSVPTFEQHEATEPSLTPSHPVPQNLVLAGRGGVRQVLAWRTRAAATAAGPLGGGVGQVGIHQLHDLFHLGTLQEELAVAHPQC